MSATVNLHRSEGYFHKTGVQVLRAGEKLSHYRLIERIGEGGMGVVWRAVDTKLEREVALKFLPEDIAHDSDRLARFEREARMLAALNDSNVAAIHHMDQAAGKMLLVLEYVPGQSLAERLKQGRFTIEEVLRTASMIARGLEAAHTRGLIHRDLKPSNVQLTPDGNVKILDFGLAKALCKVAPGGQVSRLTTVTKATGSYTVVGTAPYMSPEQASAKDLDERTDVWAFGCVLYELLTGTRAFDGNTPLETLTRIQGSGPEWNRLPARTPQSIRKLLRRCLERDLDRRLHHIADARIEIEDALSRDDFEFDGVATSSIRSIIGWSSAAFLLGVLLAGAALWTIVQLYDEGQSDASAPVRRLTIRLPAEAPITALDSEIVLSPHGDYLGYKGGIGRDSSVYILPLDGSGGFYIENSAGAGELAFAPEGNWVAFSTGKRLERYSIDSGTRVELGKAPPLSMFSWAENGQLYGVTDRDGGLFSIDALTGQGFQVAEADAEAGQLGYWWPRVIAGSEAILLNIWSGHHVSESEIAVWEPGHEKARTLSIVGAGPIYSRTGHLLYSRNSDLLAVRFDAQRLQVIGDPVRIVEDVLTSSSGFPHYSVSDDGTLVYLPAGDDPVMGWFELDGTFSLARVRPGKYYWPRVSPSGRYVAVGVDTNNWDIWIWDLERETLSRQTSETFYEFFPIWSPDESTIIYSSNRTGLANLYRKRVDDPTRAERLTTGSNRQEATSWSPDGKLIVFNERRLKTGVDVMMLNLNSGAAPVPLLNSRFDELGGQFSPDGACLAYASNESGRFEIMVLQLSGAGVRRQVSPSGGEEPRWDRAGQRVFYRRGAEVFGVSVDCTDSIRIGKSKRLFELQPPFGREARFSWDVMESGEKTRFLITQDLIGLSRTNVEMVENWTSLLGDEAESADPER